MELKFNNIFRNDKVLVFLLGSGLIFLLCYGLVANDFVYNHDSVGRMYDGMNSITSGRFMSKPLTDILAFGTYNPINASSLTFIFMTLSSIVVSKIFEIKSLFKQLLVSGFIFSYPIFAFFWWYGNDIWLYSLSLLLSIFAMYNVVKSNSVGRIIAVLCIVLSLGIYQSFLSTLTTAFIVYYILKIFKDKDVDFKNMFINFGVLVLGAVCYYIILNGLLVIYDVQMTTYKGADQIGLLSIVKNIPRSIALAYYDFTNFVLARGDFFGTAFNYSIINILAVLAYPVLTLRSIYNKYSLKVINTLIVLVMLLPIFVSSSTFLSSEINSYSQFGYLILMIGSLVIYSTIFKSGLIYMPLILLIFLNGSEVNNLLFFEQSQTSLNEQIANKIAIDIQSFDGYEDGMEVNICGVITDNDNTTYAYPSKYTFTQKRYTAGPNASIFTENLPIKMDYIFNTIGYEFNIVTNQKVCDSRINFEAEFPQDRYIVKEEDEIYINLGE